MFDFSRLFVRFGKAWFVAFDLTWFGLMIGGLRTLFLEMVWRLVCLASLAIFGLICVLPVGWCLGC